MRGTVSLFARRGDRAPGYYAVSSRTRTYAPSSRRRTGWDSIDTHFRPAIGLTWSRSGEQYLQLRRQSSGGRELRVESDTLVTGFRETKGWAPDRAIYFAMQFSSRSPPTARERSRREVSRLRQAGKRPRELPGDFRPKAQSLFRFQDHRRRGIEVKVATSRRSESTAHGTNLPAEAPGWDFDAVRAAARGDVERRAGKDRGDRATPSRKRCSTRRSITRCSRR